MTATLGKIIADFNTTLNLKVVVWATSATLDSATDDDGVALPTWTYFLTFDWNSTTSKEYIKCTLTSTALTSIQSVSRQGALTSGFARTHRKGATVTITDFAIIRKMLDLLDGTTDFNASVPLKYDGTATISNANEFATKAYVDGVAIAGGADASTTVKGITKMSVAPASAASPIAVGDNDPRVPTTDENDALVGNNTDIAVGTGNMFVTQTGLQKNAESYAATATGNDTYVITLSPVPTSLVNGMHLKFKADVANTGAATLNVNSLGAVSLVTGISTALATGDIVANQVVEVVYNSTWPVFQVLNPASAVLITPMYTNGDTTKGASDASATQNIAHGLGRLPKKVKITAQLNAPDAGLATGNLNVATTIYNWTTQSSVSSYNTSGTTSTTANTFTLNVSATSGTSTWVVTFDATNIIITWTKTGSPTGIYLLLWEAE